MKGAIFTYLLTYGGAVASLFDPFVGLLIYIAFAILRPEVLWRWGGLAGGSYSRIVAVALLAGWALRGFGRWDFGRARGVVAALLAHWAWLAVSATQAANQDQAWGFVEAISKGLLPCVVAITLMDSVARLKQLVWVIVLCQGYLAYDFNQYYYSGGFRPDEWGFGGLDNNGIAITMVTSTGMAFFLGLHARAWWQRALAFALAALMAHVVLFSMSRGGMLALTLTGAVTFLILPKQPLHYLMFLAAALLIARLAGPQVMERFGTTFAEENQRDASAQSRVELWRACWQVALDNPVVGVGPDHWRLIAHQYGFTRGKAAHTTWLNSAAETGFPGLASLLAFYLLCMARLWPLTRERREVSDPWLRHMARMVIAALVGFMVSAQFVAAEGIELSYYTAIIGAGVLRLASAPVEGSREAAPRPA